MAALRIVHYLATPGLYHTDKHVRIFSAPHSLRREHLRIVAPDVLHHPQRASGVDVDELVLRLRRDEVAVLVDEVACVHEEFRLGELQAAGLPQVLADFRLQFRIFTPGLHRLAVEAEGGDAGADVVLVAVLRHQGELAGDDGHRSLLRDGVGMVGDAAAGGVMLSLEYVLAQPVSRYVQERSLGGREKTLPDAASHVEIVVVGNVFLVVRPDLLFAFVDHCLSIIHSNAPGRCPCRFSARTLLRSAPTRRPFSARPRGLSLSFRSPRSHRIFS